MHKYLTKFSAAVLLSVVSATAYADRSKHEVVLESPQLSEKVVYARVIRVNPVYHYVTSTRPVTECWDEPVTEQRYYGRHDGSSTLAGGLLGGIIGHQIGHGRNRPVATALGTIIGAQIGHDAGNHGSSYTRYETRRNVCRVVEHEEHYEKVQDGYQVSYLLEGEEYETHLPYDPGARIKLKVQVDAH